MGKPTLANVNARTLQGTLLLASSLSFLPGCEQPPPKCDVTQSMETGGNFAAKYALLKGSETGTGDCGMLPGEVLYFGSFYKPNADDTPNYARVSIGIQPESTLGPLENAAGAMVEPNPKDKPYAYGAFDRSEPDGKDFCLVSELSPARVRLPMAPAWQGRDPSDYTGEAPMITNPAQPDIDLTYEFSNVEVYMTVGSPGRQIKADLTYSRREGTDVDCSAKFSVTALFPATYCGLDEAGAPVGDKESNDSACRDNPIFADDAVECDLALHLCVLVESVPSFR